MAEPVSVSIRALCEFVFRGGSIDARFSGLDRGVEGGRIHRWLQKQGGPDYVAEVPLSMEIPHGDFVFALSGRADGVESTPDGVMVDEIKTMAADPGTLQEDTGLPLYGEGAALTSGGNRAAHWAQGCCYAYILCRRQGLEEVTVRLTYYGMETGSIRRFSRVCTAGELSGFMERLLGEYARWAALKRDMAAARNAGLQKLRFPFEEYRQGQRGLAIGVYRTCEAGGRLFACAPTGIGKTMSTLFPALKAMGEGYGERIFYLTAKTSTRAAAEQALARLRRESGGALPPACLTLTAKDKVCFLEERACLPEACPWADGYYDRVNRCLYGILQKERVFGRERIEALAKEHRLCPYELSLDLAVWCDVVICDYNYLFDPVVHLQRFFEGGGQEAVFLVDEAHNLLDRAREMYSAQLAKTRFYGFKKQLPKHFKKLHRALGRLNRAFVALRKECGQEERETLVRTAPPEDLAAALEDFLAAAAAFLEDHRGHEQEQPLLALYFEALFYARIAEGYGDNYTTLVTAVRGEVLVRLFCLDPAPFLQESMDKGRASVLFSATLHPLAYYRKTLGGGEGAKLLALPSPFRQQNLGLFVAGDISTRYADREAGLGRVAELLAAMAQARPGNYIAYFPSYSYLRQVLEAFETRYPEIPTLVQQPGMSEAEQEAFLASFAPQGQRVLLGFCVLGGVFSEGVDLVGERLVGTAVVGVGLPQIGPEPDAVRRYWDGQGADGFAYAYQFPGMNKVLQAAGRVVRGAGETGVVLLVDSRFVSRRYQEIFPAHWSHWRRVDRRNIARELDGYWARVRQERDGGQTQGPEETGP